MSLIFKSLFHPFWGVWFWFPLSKCVFKSFCLRLYHPFSFSYKCFLVPTEVFYIDVQVSSFCISLYLYFFLLVRGTVTGETPRLPRLTFIWFSTVYRCVSKTRSFVVVAVTFLSRRHPIITLPLSSVSFVLRGYEQNEDKNKFLFLTSRHFHS